MIVHCPSCETAYRQPAASGAAAAAVLGQCGRCDTEFALSRRKAYRLIGAAVAAPAPVAELPVEAFVPEQPQRDLPPLDGPRRTLGPMTTVSSMATIGAAAGYYGPALTAASWPLLTGAGTGAVLGLLSGWLWLRVSNRKN